MDIDTGEFNYTGLVENMEWKAGSFYGMVFVAGFRDIYLLDTADCV